MTTLAIPTTRPASRRWLPAAVMAIALLVGACAADRPAVTATATAADARGSEAAPPRISPEPPPPPPPPPAMAVSPPPPPPPPPTARPPTPTSAEAVDVARGPARGTSPPSRQPAPKSAATGVAPTAGVPALPVPVPPVPPVPAVDPLVAQFQPGLVAWKTPPTMRQGEQVPVKASVTLTPAQVEALKDTLKDAPGTVTVEAHAFTRNLGARLIPGDGLSVTPTDLQRSVVLEGGIATFAWTVTAKQTGQRELILQVASYVDGPAAKESQVLGSFTRQIDVEVGADTFWQILDKHWEKLLTVVLLPLGAWLVQRWRRRRGGGGDDDVAPGAKEAAAEHEPLRKAA